MQVLRRNLQASIEVSCVCQTLWELILLFYKFQILEVCYGSRLVDYKHTCGKIAAKKRWIQIHSSKTEIILTFPKTQHWIQYFFKNLTIRRRFCWGEGNVLKQTVCEMVEFNFHIKSIICIECLQRGLQCFCIFLWCGHICVQTNTFLALLEGFDGLLSTQTSGCTSLSAFILL